MHIYTLKSIIQYYKDHNSPAYSCFLDSLKAFDKVNHSSKWCSNKWKTDKSPALGPIIRILLVCYREQLIFVKLGCCTSPSFKVTNGVSQGSIMSPKLFAIDVDALTLSLIKRNIGCMLDKVCFNHMFYADDLCLMAPCPIALQTLLDICHEYGVEHDVIYNPLKSVCMFFKPGRFSLKCPLVHIRNHVLEYQEKVQYLGVLLNTLSAKYGDLRLSSSNACQPNTEISVFVTGCVFSHPHVTDDICSHCMMCYTVRKKKCSSLCWYKAIIVWFSQFIMTVVQH